MPMQEKLISYLSILSSPDIVVWILVAGFLIPSYFLWHNLKGRKKKNIRFFRQEHVFDFIVFSFLLGIILSRVLYIYLNWETFNQVRWFIIPYERVEDQTLWFESFPWLFFKMGIQTVRIEGFALGFYLGINTARSIHRLEWKKISLAIADFVGLIGIFGSWVAYIIIDKDYLIYPILILSTVWIMKQLTRDSFDYFRNFTRFLWKLSAHLWFPFILIYSHISRGLCCNMSIDLLFIILISIYSLYFVIWSIDISFFKKGSKKPRRVERKIPARKGPRRSYSLSYRSLTSGWWNKIMSFFKKSKDEK